MTIEEFNRSLKNSTPPKGLPQLLEALWWDAKGNWDKAHSLADGAPIVNAEWVHAYLHRKEGDQWNAGYWYRRAGRNLPDMSLEEEWNVIVEALL